VDKSCHYITIDVPIQVLLSVLASEPRGGHVIRRLQQEVQKQATRANHDVTPITMALMAGFQHSKAAHNLSSMLSKDSLNPADIVQLHRSLCFCVPVRVADSYSLDTVPYQAFRKKMPQCTFFTVVRRHHFGAFPFSDPTFRFTVRADPDPDPDEAPDSTPSFKIV
jgi:hypothetical protein